MTQPRTLPAFAASMPHPHHKKKINPAKLHAEVKAALGINLMAELPADTVHGHISTASFPAQAQAVTCGLCDDTVPAGQAHDCCEVILYETAQAPNAERQSTIAPHGLNVAQKAQLLALITAHQP